MKAYLAVFPVVTGVMWATLMTCAITECGGQPMVWQAMGISGTCTPSMPSSRRLTISK